MIEKQRDVIAPHVFTAGLPWGEANVNTVESQIDQMGRLGQAPEGWKRTAGRITAGVLLLLIAGPLLWALGYWVAQLL